MTDLTEQWKKGELPSGWYWVDYYSVDGAVMLEYIPQHNGFGYEEKELVQAVLAPVPSCEEWQASYNCMLENEVLRLKNAQLKELLKECKRQFEEVELYRCDVADTDQEDWFKISTEQASVANKMITKINQALGEDK